MKLDHIHPLAVFEEVDLGAGEEEPVSNIWGSATVLTLALEEQGAHGKAAESIKAMLAAAGHLETDTQALIQQVLAGTDVSQARLRTLQQQLAEAIHQACEQQFGKEGSR
jgi:hypothetical protein